MNTHHRRRGRHDGSLRPKWTRLWSRFSNSWPEPLWAKPFEAFFSETLYYITVYCNPGIFELSILKLRYYIFYFYWINFLLFSYFSYNDISFYVFLLKGLHGLWVGKISSSVDLCFVAITVGDSSRLLLICTAKKKRETQKKYGKSDKNESNLSSARLKMRKGIGGEE